MSRFAAVVSEPRALYPRKCGELRKESFSFSEAGRAKNLGIIAIRSETAF